MFGACTTTADGDDEPGATMLACAYDRHGSVQSNVRVRHVPRPPHPGPGQLLVQVHAASLNPADWKSAGGEQQALLSFRWPRVFGFDFSGVIEAVPMGESEWSVGESVFGMIKGLPERDRGTVAEYVLVDASVCARKPEGADHASAACLPLVSITAIMGLEKCGLTHHAEDVDAEALPAAETPGPRVFITGGAGGVGIHAIQIAKRLYRASYVATTASAGRKTELCQRMGADRVVDYHAETFEDALRDEEAFDAVLDTTGEAARCVALLKPGGGLCSILAGAGAKSVRSWLERTEWPRARITPGVHGFLTSSWGGGIFSAIAGASALERACKRRGLNTTFDHVIGSGDGRIMRLIAKLVAEAKLEAVVDREFALADAVAAIEHQKAGRCAGKVCIRVARPPPCEAAGR